MCVIIDPYSNFYWFMRYDGCNMCLHPFWLKLIEFVLLGGHCLRLHGSTSELTPAQYFPLLDGGGLVHDRSRDRIPPPQLFEQEVQEVQSDHEPSTGFKAVK